MRPGGGGWNCAFCGALAPVSGDDVRARGPLAAWPEFGGGGGVGEYEGMVGDGGSDDLRPPPAPIAVVVADVAGGRGATAAVRAALHSAIASLPSDTLFALVLAGRAVSLADGGACLDAARGGGPAAAAGLPGAEPPAAALIDGLLPGALASVGGADAAAVAAAFAGLVRAEPGGRVEVDERPRALGAAVAIALAVIESASVAGSFDALAHVVVVAAGPPTVGPGASRSKHAPRFWDDMAARAAAAGASVDVVCVGDAGARAAPTLGRLAGGGRLILHPPGAQGLGARLADALASRVALAGTLELRATPPLSAALVAPHPDAGRATATAGVPCLTVALPAPRPGQCLAFSLDVASPLLPEGALVQAVVRWRDAGTRSLRVRVQTAVVSPAADARAALARARPDLTALLIAKRAAVAALAAGASEMTCSAAEASFAKAVATAGAATRERVRAAGWLARGGRWRLPLPLLPLADALYCAARSPAFAARTAGDRARALSLVAGAAPEAALRTLRPGLYVADPAIAGLVVDGATEGKGADGGDGRRDSGDRGDGTRLFSLLPVPPGDLALAASPAAVLDCGDEIFVWVAPGCCGGAAASARRAAAALAARRCPPPAVRTVAVDSPSAQAASWRLYPSHRDSDADAVAAAPFLASLSPAALAAARRRAAPTGDPSLLEWCRDAGVEPLFDLKARE